MGVRFACHGCGKPLNIKSELAGKRGKCPSCGLRFRIPIEDQDLSIPLEDEPDNKERESTPAPTALTEQPKPNTSSVTTQTEETKIAFDPFEDPQAQWYVRPPSGGRYGPADGPTLKLWINEGRIPQDTLLWRDGWAQWRSGDEVIPKWIAEKGQNEKSPSDRTANDRSTPPTPVEVSPTPSFSASPNISQQRPAEIALKPDERKPQEPYPTLKRRRNSNQRVIIVVCLVVSVVLLAALIAVMLWPRQSDEETQRGLERPPYRALR